MKNFASPSFRLRDASFEIRLIYSLFLIFILCGLATIWFLQFQRIGISYERVVAIISAASSEAKYSSPKISTLSSKKPTFTHSR